MSESRKKQLGRYRTIFIEEQEMEPVEYLKVMDSMFYGLTRREFMGLAYDFAQKNNIAHPLNWDKNRSAGNEWFMAYNCRHPGISLRKPEPTTIARARSFNRPASTIYNMDETGIQATTNKLPRILSVCGKKQVGIISSAERGKLTTKVHARESYDAPPRTQATCTGNGLSNGEAFLQWLHFSVEHVRSNNEKKILLLLENHESHKYYPALQFTADNNVLPQDRMPSADSSLLAYGPTYNPNNFGDEDYAPALVTEREVNEKNCEEIGMAKNSCSNIVSDTIPTLEAEAGPSKVCASSLKDIRPLPTVQQKMKLVENAKQGTTGNISVKKRLLAMKSVKHGEKTESEYRCQICEVPYDDPPTED
ncbi:hypothetical protein PR048_008779 [Dryococelus australis]|uniref:DDE-1 domain-containing protein n=1 Tax=Dryococelus australis TaxID=614101 RepID=A0ABQ9HYX5_9NEOP|nr:hypothetical protein PR048_008779 [Dryococelus australis]